MDLLFEVTWGKKHVYCMCQHLNNKFGYDPPYLGLNICYWQSQFRFASASVITLGPETVLSSAAQSKTQVYTNPEPWRWLNFVNILFYQGTLNVGIKRNLCPKQLIRRPQCAHFSSAINCYSDKWINLFLGQRTSTGKAGSKEQSECRLFSMLRLEHVSVSACLRRFLPQLKLACLCLCIFSLILNASHEVKLCENLGAMTDKLKC